MTTSSATGIQSEAVGLPAGTQPRSPMPTTIACRALDLVVAVPLLILMLPLVGLIALAIKLDTRGPVLFRQRRYGLGLREFTMNKFRTMHVNASADPHREFVLALIKGTEPPSGNGNLYKLEGDDRITRVGRLLRRTSLDELPQLWNVVTGEMSLVGPRPSIPYEVESFPPEWFQRFSVKSGITGLWQVNGRSQVDMDRMVELDLEYAQRRSFWLNLRILAKTILVVAHGKGAA